MWDDFDTAAAQVAAAVTATDLFGPFSPSGPRRDAAHAEFRRLARQCHPDRQVPGRLATAEVTFSKLGQLWRSWQRSNRGWDAFTITTRGHQWVGGRRLGGDEVCDVYGAHDHDRAGSAWVKIPRRPADSDLVANEAAVLAQLSAGIDARWRPYVPRLVETVRHREPTGEERRVNVVAPLEGFRSLAEVAGAFPSGLDPRDAAWMWRRLLVALGAAHRAGVVHGALVPEHVFIEPEAHGLVVADWYYATLGAGQRLPALIEDYRSWYPPEVASRRPVSPATDLFMAARLMRHLIGGRLNGPMRAFIAGCTLAAPARRPDDAWRLLAELDDLLDRLWGPRRFRPFHLPAPT
jgi:hypothetical protein